MPYFLNVDQNPDSSELLEALLRYRGHESEPASSSEGALAKLRHRRPDVIAINPMLPDGSGFDLCDSLKSRRATCLIPVIIVTSLPGDHFKESSFRAGSNVHVII